MKKTLESISAVIEESWRVFNEGEVEEALEIITNLEESESQSPEAQLRCQVAKGMFNFFLGNFGETINIGENAYKEGKKQNKPLLAVDALFVAYMGYYMLNRSWEVRSYVNLCKELLESAMHQPQSEIEKSQVHFCLINGMVKGLYGELDTAIDSYRKAVEISENSELLYYARSIGLAELGRALMIKGEYDLALNSHKNALEYLKGNSILMRMQKAGNYHDIGYINLLQGDLGASMELNEKSLDIVLKSSDTPMLYVGYNYAVLIKIHLLLNSIEKAKDYLQKFQKYNEKLPHPTNIGMYHLAKAQILKISTRIQDWTEAMNIFKGLISKNTLILFVIPELCDLYLRELQITNDPKILEECQPLIEKLLNITQNSNIYFNAWARLLQGKIALLQMNLGDARRYLTQAQDTAEKYGLQLLAQEISVEHDKLLEQLGEWEKFKNRNIPYTERVNKASLEQTMEGVLGRRGVKPPKLESEKPLLLSIITEGGVLLFSYAFTEDWERDNEIFGSFLTAFSSFSDEYFSEGLDRAKFGKYTVLINSIKNFSICFLFTGQSYQAKQKLTRFVDHLKENTNIQDALDKFQETSQVLELPKFPFLKSLISEIFIKN